EYSDHPLSKVRRVLRELEDFDRTREQYANLSVLEHDSLELSPGVAVLVVKVREAGKTLRHGAVSEALNVSHLKPCEPDQARGPQGLLLDLRRTGYVFAGEDLTHVLMTMTM